MLGRCWRPERIAAAGFWMSITRGWHGAEAEDRSALIDLQCNLGGGYLKLQLTMPYHRDNWSTCFKGRRHPPSRLGPELARCQAPGMNRWRLADYAELSLTPFPDVACYFNPLKTGEQGEYPEALNNNRWRGELHRLANTGKRREAGTFLARLSIAYAD